MLDLVDNPSEHVYKHLHIDELAAVTTQQLASVAQLFRALHRNRRAAGSIPARVSYSVQCCRTFRNHSLFENPYHGNQKCMILVEN